MTMVCPLKQDENKNQLMILDLLRYFPIMIQRTVSSAMPKSLSETINALHFLERETAIYLAFFFLCTVPSSYEIPFFPFLHDTRSLHASWIPFKSFVIEVKNLYLSFQRNKCVVHFLIRFWNLGYSYPCMCTSLLTVYVRLFILKLRSLFTIVMIDVIVAVGRLVSMVLVL